MWDVAVVHEDLPPPGIGHLPATFDQFWVFAHTVVEDAVEFEAIFDDPSPARVHVAGKHGVGDESDGVRGKRVQGK